MAILYLHSYQSYLWNKSVDLFIKNFQKENKNKDELFLKEMPLLGFDSDYPEEFKEVVEKILKEEDISHRDFIIKYKPEFSLEGAKRRIFVKVEDLFIHTLEQDELNQKKKKSKIFFTLPKGSYATECIKQIFKK